VFEVKPAGDAEVSAAIDREVLARLQQEGIVPAPRADDAEFLRRVTLDLAGRIPTLAEAFFADDSPDKRTRRIDVLLSDREMPYYWLFSTNFSAKSSTRECRNSFTWAGEIRGNPSISDTPLLLKCRATRQAREHLTYSS
jgi:hypothetical protein